MSDETPFADADLSPVPDDTCLSCDVPRDQWEEDVTGYRVVSDDEDAPDELLCSRCRDRNRAWGPDRPYQLLVWAELPPEAIRITADHHQRAQDEVSRLGRETYALPYVYCDATRYQTGVLLPDYGDADSNTATGSDTDTDPDAE